VNAAFLLVTTAWLGADAPPAAAVPAPVPVASNGCCDEGHHWGRFRGNGCGCETQRDSCGGGCLEKLKGLFHRDCDNGCNPAPVHHDRCAPVHRECAPVRRECCAPVHRECAPVRRECCAPVHRECAPVHRECCAPVHRECAPVHHNECCDNGGGLKEWCERFKSKFHRSGCDDCCGTNGYGNGYGNGAYPMRAEPIPAPQPGTAPKKMPDAPPKSASTLIIE